MPTNQKVGCSNHSGRTIKTESLQIFGPETGILLRREAKRHSGMIPNTIGA